MNSLPLLSFVSNLYPNIDLSKVSIIGCQHILATQLNLFEELELKKIKPNHLYLIGKCYSTNKETYDEFVKRNVSISSNSFSYDSTKTFDQQFEIYVMNFLVEARKEILISENKKIIFIDCGGAVLSLVSKVFKEDSIEIIGIEQTSSGYHIIKNLKLEFPIINVARSWAKGFEGEFLADVAYEKINEYIVKTSITNPNILIIGNGIIGGSLKKRIAGSYPVTIYDINEKLSEKSGFVKQHLSGFNVIIGATGTSSISNDELLYIKPKTHLISISSSDREFPSHCSQKELPKRTNPHSTFVSNGIFFVNGGFPINFDGTEKSLPNEKAQLVVALILAAIYEAVSKSFKDGIVELDKSLQQNIVKRFKELC